MTRDVNRYARQVALPGFGLRAQEKLEASHALVIGAGGLGSPVLLYLAAAGIGEITIVDGDRLSLDNMHRQIVHNTVAVGQPKVISAAQHLHALNPHVTVHPVDQYFSPELAPQLLTSGENAPGVLIDGSDNFATRHICSWAATQVDIPHVWASILGWEAQMAVFGPHAVYEDLYPTPPPPGTVPSCSASGVLGPVVGQAGTAMATEAIKALTDTSSLLDQIGYLNAATGFWEYLPLVGNPEIKKQVFAGKYLPPQIEQVAEIPPEYSLIDVRAPAEFSSTDEIFAPLPGARNIPHTEIIERLHATPADTPILVYCATGVRSKEAAEALMRRGHTRVISLAGGLAGFRGK